MRISEHIWIKLGIRQATQISAKFCWVKQLNLAETAVFNSKSGKLDLIQFIQPSFAWFNLKIR